MCQDQARKSVVLRDVDPEGPSARWCLDRYYAELDARFEGGFDPGNSGYAGAGDGSQTRTVLACEGDSPVGCASLIWSTLEVGEIKRMWVSPSARGHGIARLMLGHLEDVARAAGLKMLHLDTNRVLPEAQALYRKAGYRDIPRYSDNPYAHHWFGKDL